MSIQRAVRAPVAVLHRALVAAAIATLAAFELYRLYLQLPEHHTDFYQVWAGAKVLLEGGNPYELVGPGKKYHILFALPYPATALAAVIPFTFISEHAGSLIFVWLSTFALAYGVMGKGWYLLPIFASEAFLSSVHLAQWTIPLTAALFIPWLAAFGAVKPQTGLSVLAGSPRTATLKATLIGGAVLIAVSLALRPSWPVEWLEVVRSSRQMIPPVTRLGGVFILLALLRWRRPETWLILSMACLPQNSSWYTTLPLLTVAQNFRESAALSIVSTLGVVTGSMFVWAGVSDEFRFWSIGGMLTATAYLPAVIVVLMRPNEWDADWSSIHVRPS